GRLSWLGELSSARYVEFRRDRFVVALDLDENHPDFRVVYVARAATKGNFAHPGAVVKSETDSIPLARSQDGRLQVIDE
ncbi:MAG: hypothetical protein WCK65_06895, partial [Rhodospirillaceae bacterium]